MLSVKISEVKQEYQLQEWSGMLREQKESGLSVKAWCQEHGLAEHIYYYRLRKLRLTTKAGTLETMDADRSVLDQVLQAMLHAE